MRYLYLFVFCFLFALNSSSQKFVEKGATWHYSVRSYQWLQSPIYRTLKAEYNKDSIINSKLCQEIAFTGARPDLTYFHDKAFLYEKDSVVYFWEVTFKRFSVLYDLGAKKDSMWTTEYFDYAKNRSVIVHVKVDSVGVREINGDSLKTLYVNYFLDSTFQQGYKSEIIDKIGDKNSMFNLPAGYFHGDGISGLRCYEDSTTGFHNFGITPSCTYTNVSVDELNSSYSIKIFPNPSNSYFNIETDIKSDFQILDFSGKVVLENSLKKGKNRIDIQNLKVGVYILKLENGPIRKVYRVVKE